MEDRCPFPDCARPLEGLGRFCHGCGRYAADFGKTEAPKAPRAAAGKELEDTRSETEIQQSTKEKLEMLGFQVWDTSQPFAAAITAGLADLFVVGHGVCAWVEMKSAKGKQRPAQIEFQKAVQANGGLYLLARNEREVIEWLQSAGMRLVS